MGNYYKDGVQGYTNQDSGKYNKDTSRNNTTFQKRGYLSIKCDPDYIIGRSDKSIEEQLEILRVIRAKSGVIEANGVWKSQGSAIDRKFSEAYNYGTDGYLQ